MSICQNSANVHFRFVPSTVGKFCLKNPQILTSSYRSAGVGGEVSWCLQLALNCVEGRWVAGWRGGGELDSQKQSGVQADSPGGAAGGPQHDSSDSYLC